MKYIQNIECGNIFPYTSEGMREAMDEAMELYDLDDFTNACEFWEYYEIIEAWENHASIKKIKKVEKRAWQNVRLVIQ